MKSALRSPREDRGLNRAAVRTLCICPFPQRLRSGWIFLLQPTQQTHRRALLFAVVLLLSVVPLLAQSSATNYVLELDGASGYVELPPSIFNDLDEATVEAWVKWRSFPATDKCRLF